MGVMLALSAVFAVVISTISMPGDSARAQMLSETEQRAKAWWDTLTPDQRINALAGKEYDETADDNATRVDTEHAETGSTAADTTTHGEALVMDYAGQTTAGYKTTIDELVDGAMTSGVLDALTAIPVDPPHTSAATTSVDPTSSAIGTTDIYAVGEHEGDIAQAIRGFQSVELWWNHLTCAEARVAVGEDRDSLEQTFDHDGDDDTTPTILEVSDYCAFPEGTTSTGATVAADAVSYANLVADAKAQADKVGQAILGLSSAGSASSTDPRAKAWWDSLISTERLNALYGSNATDATAATVTDTAGNSVVDAGDSVAAPRNFLAGLEYDQIQRSTTFAADGTVTDAEDDLEYPLDSASMDLADEVKALINDRWRYIYAMGGSNTMGTSELVYWWNSLDSAQRRIAAGVDNAPEVTPSAAGFSVDWNELNPLTDGTGTDATTKAREEQVFEVGQAILGHKKLPDVEAWWNTLNPDQMVYVVYGNPPMRTPWDDDGDNGTTPLAPTVTDADKAVFKKMYDALADDDGIRVAGATDALSTHLEGRTGLLARNGFDVTAPTAGPDGDDADSDPDYYYYSAKGIVDAIASEIFDPPAMLTAFVRPDRSLVGTSASDDTTVVGPVTDDNDFDWPYNSDNKAANVADWWETTDCRVMRIAVGQDNQYLNGAIADDTGTTDIDESMDPERSIYCGHFPGADAVNADGTNVLSEMAQQRVTEVGSALLGLTSTDNGLHAVRPSFNEPPARKNAALPEVTIDGVAQVGQELTANTDNLNDADGLGTFSYQWLRNGSTISGAVGMKYTVQAADASATLSVTVSYVDGERYPEMVTSGVTSTITGSPGEISKIEPGIRGVTVSAGERVVLSVKAYGLQGIQDQKLSAGMGLEWNAEDGGSVETAAGDDQWQVIHTARSSPGTYTVVASFVNDGDCVADLEERDDACTADFVVRVRRAAPPQPVEEAPVNPPGEIPSLLSDDGGNQYEVFTPVEGGTFDSGEGYSITAPSGAVPNGEFIGVRMSDDGPASNLGMTHQRYTLGGNMYGVHAVDSSEATVSSYVLDDPANVCVPLPDELRTNISDLALVVINSDGSLTILAANVHIGAAGTSVCGNLSNLPASVAVGSQGAPAAIPTATPEPEPVLPDTGATAPTSNSALWALILGIAIVSLGTLTALSRRRNRSVSR